MSYRYSSFINCDEAEYNVL